MKRLLIAEIYKLRILAEHRAFLATCFLSAIVSVTIINILGIHINDVPMELLEQMRFNNMYTFGFIQVNEISELSDMTSFFVISSAFKNFSPTIAVAIFVSVFLKNEFKNGGIRNFLLKGFERKDVLLSKYLIISLVVAFGMILYIVGYILASLILFSNEGFMNYSIINLLIFFVLEIFLHISFATICFMTSIRIKNHLTAFLNASMVVGGTMFINNLRVFTNGRYDLSRYWVLDYVVSLSPLESADYRQYLFATMFTLLGSYVIAKRYFMKIQFE